jgi:hypothetical protein
MCSGRGVANACLMHGINNLETHEGKVSLRALELVMEKLACVLCLILDRIES